MRGKIAAILVLMGIGTAIMFAELKDLSFNVVQIFVNGERQILDRKADAKASLFISLYGSYAEIGLQGFSGSESGVFTYNLVTNINKIKKVLSLNSVVDDRYLRSTFTTAVDSALLPSEIAGLPEWVLSTNIGVDLLPAKYSEFEKFQADIHNQLIEGVFAKEIMRRLKPPYPDVVSAKVYFTALPEQNIDAENYTYMLRFKLVWDSTNTIAR